MGREIFALSTQKTMLILLRAYQHLRYFLLFSSTFKGLWLQQKARAVLTHRVNNRKRVQHVGTVITSTLTPAFNDRSD